MNPRKALGWIFALVVLICFGCSIKKEDLTAVQAATLENLEQQEKDAAALVAQAEANLATALTIGDEDVISYARAKLLGAKGELEAAEDALAQFETDVLRARAGPIVAALSALPFVGKFAVLASPFMMSLVPLAGKRGRRKYRDALANVNPFENPPAGSGASNKFFAPIAALTDLLRGMGALHSTPESALAAGDGGTAGPGASTPPAAAPTA